MSSEGSSRAGHFWTPIAARLGAWGEALGGSERGEAGRPISPRCLSAVLFAGFFVIALLRAYPQLAPPPEAINAANEAGYLYSGETLLQGTIPALAYHPLVTAMAAVADLVFANSPMGFIQAEWLLRAVLYLALWAALWPLALEFEPWIPAWSFAALWVLTGLPERLLGDISVTLFTILFSLGLWQVIRYSSQGGLRHLLAASAVLGLAMLARDEALWILLLTALAVVFLGYLRSREERTSPMSDLGRRYAIPLLAYLLPFLLINLAFLAIYVAHTGRFATGLRARSYDNLEQEQGLAYPGRYSGDLYVAGVADSDRIFGTRQENDYSVLRAVMRNPRAMLDRVAHIALQTPVALIKGYGGIIGVLLMVFVFSGLLALIRERQWRFLTALVGFCLFELVYIVFMAFPPFWLIIFPVAFGLTGTGIREILRGRATWFWVLVAVAAAVALVGAAVTGSLRFLYVGLALAAFLLVAFWAARTSPRIIVQALAVGTLVFVMASPTYAQAPNFTPDLSADGMAQAASWLQANAAPEAKVAAWGGTMVNLSRRPFLSLEGYLTTPSVLQSWLVQNGIGYVYTDPELVFTWPADMTAINALVARGCLRLQFQDSQGFGKLYQVETPCRP